MVEQVAPITAWQIPQASLCFFSLIMGMLSFWIKRSPWIWGSFFVISYFLAYFAKIVTPVSLVPLIFLFFLHGILKTGLGKTWRLALILIVSFISYGLWFHLFPGFYQWKVLYPHIFWNYGYPFIGICILAWGFPLVSTKQGWRDLLSVSIPFSILGTFLLLILGIWGKIIVWHPKFLSSFWLWAVSNLCFVVIPQEAFVRGFLQKECYQWLEKKTFLASFIAVLFSSICFSLFYIGWLTGFLSIVWILTAGILFGTLYQYTKCIESSILFHFLFNVSFILLF